MNQAISESLESCLNLVFSEVSTRYTWEVARTAGSVLLSTTTTTTTDMNDDILRIPNNFTSSDLCKLTVEVAEKFCEIDSDPTRKRKKSGWHDMQAFCRPLLLSETPLERGNLLAITLLFGALSLSQHQGSKAAASALSNTVIQQWGKGGKKDSLAYAVRQDVLPLLHNFFLRHAELYQTEWNWNIVTQFARAFYIKEGGDDDDFRDDDEGIGLDSTLVATVVRRELSRAELYSTDWARRKPIVAGMLGLVCQLHPWSSDLTPLELVQAAVPLDFWHAAEEVCLCHPSPQSAVEYLIDTSFDDHTYRRADHLATNLYEKGGRSRFVEARYQHACDTITKVIRKRQLPIIDRQVTRVDESIEKVRQDPNGVLDEGGGRDVSREIRSFVLTRLEEVGEFDTAHRLATTVWGMEDYAYDEESLKIAAQTRRDTYLQFDEVFSGSIPDVISDPLELRKTFETFWKGGPYPHGPFGLDAEWEADVKGIDLLQLSHPQEAILIDIPALQSTPQGIQALKETVGKLFDSKDTVVAGFACRQDLSRLRQGEGGSIWMGGTKAVIDIQSLVLQRQIELAEISPRVGLARVCAYYFKKPLDKAEQCSFWAARPLSIRQRSYAALDAWVCAAVYEILKNRKE